MCSRGLLDWRPVVFENFNNLKRGLALSFFQTLLRPKFHLQEIIMVKTHCTATETGKELLVADACPEGVLLLSCPCE